MISVVCVLAVVLLCTSTSRAADMVRIGPERPFSRYATVESKEMRIHWNPEVSNLPGAVDFLQSSTGPGKAALWTSSLDGVGDRNEQVIAVRNLPWGI